MVHIRHAHLVAEFRDWPEHAGDNFIGDNPGYKEQKQEDGDDGCDMPCGLSLKVLRRVREGGGQYGYHAGAAVENRCIHGVEAAPANLLFLDVETLVCLGDIVESVLVQAVAKDHPVVYFRGGAYGFLAGRVKQGYVTAEASANVVHFCTYRHGIQFFIGVHLAQFFLHHGLQDVHSGDHDVLPFRHGTLLDKPHTESGHGHKCEEKGEIQHQAYAVLEVP